MYRMVGVDARGDHLVIASHWTSEGRYPLFMLGDWAQRAEEPVDDAALGRLVREAFTRCLVGVPWPDMRNDPDGNARFAGLLKLGKARSGTAYVRITRHVSLRWDDEKRTIKLMSWRSTTRPGGAFEGIPGAEIAIKDKVSDAELGLAVRQAIAAAKSLVG